LDQGPGIASPSPDGVLALFHKARLIDHQAAFRIAHRRGHELMIGPPHVLLIPDHITQKALQPPDGPALHVEGHGLDRLPLEWAQLAHHIIEEMGARLTPGKTVVKGGLEFPEFLQEPLYIGGGEVKGGNRKAFIVGPTGWQHTRSPPGSGSIQEQHTVWSLS